MCIRLLLKEISEERENNMRSSSCDMMEFINPVIEGMYRGWDSHFPSLPFVGLCFASFSFKFSVERRWNRERGKSQNIWNLLKSVYQQHVDCISHMLYKGFFLSHFTSCLKYFWRWWFCWVFCSLACSHNHCFGKRSWLLCLLMFLRSAPIMEKKICVAGLVIVVR